MLQTALLVKCGRRAEALELLRKAGDGGAGNGRERMVVELAFAEEDWTGARKGAMRLAESETKPAERDRWRFLSGLCAYNLKDYAGAAEAWASVETERWRSLAAPWRAEVKFLLS